MRTGGPAYYAVPIPKEGTTDHGDPHYIVLLEISDVGLMNKATRITRHKAGIGVEQGMCYVLDQTDEGYHPHRVSINTERKCGCI